MWNAGVHFFWCFFLLGLGLLGNGIAHGLHDGVELGGVVLGGHHIDIPAFISLFLGEKEQHAELLC